MNKLKKIINQIDKENYRDFEESLKGNNSVKFLTLLKLYKENKLGDEDIKNQLNCTDNSYYVLKSRLYDKIQKYLIEVNPGLISKDASTTNTDISRYLNEFQPETAIAMLLELENKYINIDSPNELINVYSALKKAHFYTDKFYTYSQLYNNQIAYLLAIEKTEETLFNFNKTLASYYFTSNNADIELIEILIKEIKNLYSLYKSPRVEIIHNIILIETYLFAKTEFESESPIEDLLSRSEQIIDQYKNDIKVSLLAPVISYLNFEYYLSLNQLKKSATYYQEIDKNLNKWLLQNNSCLSFHFLLSKINYLNITNNKAKIDLPDTDYFFDQNDLFTSVMYRFYLAIANYNHGKIKTSINILNEILNEVSFKNYFYIETEIKLTLSYFYILNNEIENCDNTLKGLSRKVVSLKSDSNRNIKEAIKLLTLLSNGLDTSADIKKYKETLELFSYYNYKGKKVLTSFERELEQFSLRNRR